ncbi:MAG: GspE/PulE family protein [Candidatus Xenobia bacterium]
MALEQQLDALTREMQRKAEAMRTTYVDLSRMTIEREIAQLIPETMARRYRLICIGKRADNKLVCAMEDPQDVFALDDIKIRTKYDVEPVLCHRQHLEDCWPHVYGQDDKWTELIKDASTSSAVELLKDGGEDETGEGMQTKDGQVVVEQPIVQLVNKLLMEALQRKASDIHIEPFEDGVVVRYRVDGILHEMSTRLPRAFHPAVIARIKIMAQLKIDEKRVPQDGRIRISMTGSDVDLRVSTVPTMYGESVVMRILDKKAMKVELTVLGFAADDLKNWEAIVERPNGIILVTGPTGSGKSTTLYATLNKLNKPDIKILTVEDPVEYNLRGVVQVQTNPRVGLTFASALRSFLRQDPDIIMLGEIRDKETATIAVESALTGHLVLSTLHTNDAVTSVTRLTDMGVEPFLISSTMCAVLAQRLLRQVCANCKKAEPLAEELAEVFSNHGIDPLTATPMKGAGCGVCNNTGYKGRLGIYELLVVTDKFRELIVKRVSSPVLLKQAREDGMTLLFEDGLKKVASGQTTYEELLGATAE